MFRLNGDSSKNIYLKEDITSVTSHLCLKNKYNVYILHRLLLFLDSPSSSVQGIVTEEGHFDGHISTPTEHFYIEPAKR